MIHEELWRPIEDFHDYQISNLGRVMHNERPETPRKIGINAQGFPTLTLFKKEHGGSRYVRQVNKLVANAFLPPPSTRESAVWHIDGDLLNCQADNLRWDLRSRVLEWNAMHRDDYSPLRTPHILINETGDIYANAYEAALAVGITESQLIRHVESYPPHLADRARYKYAS